MNKYGARKISVGGLSFNGEREFDCWYASYCADRKEE